MAISPAPTARSGSSSSVTDQRRLTVADRALACRHPAGESRAAGRPRELERALLLRRTGQRTQEARLHALFGGAFRCQVQQSLRSPGFRIHEAAVTSPTPGGADSLLLRPIRASKQEPVQRGPVGDEPEAGPHRPSAGPLPGQRPIRMPASSLRCDVPFEEILGSRDDRNTGLGTRESSGEVRAGRRVGEPVERAKRRSRHLRFGTVASMGPGSGASSGPRRPSTNPGGPVLLVPRRYRPSVVDDHAARAGGVLVVLPTEPGSNRERALQERGWTVASGWYLGAPR